MSNKYPIYPNLELLDEITTTVQMSTESRIMIPVNISRRMGLKPGSMVEITIRALEKNRSPTDFKLKNTACKVKSPGEPAENHH